MEANGSGSRRPEPEQQPQLRHSKEARLAIMELANMISVPMSLHAVVNLAVPDAIWRSGANTPLSADEILPLLRPSPAPSPSAANLQRLLRLLSAHGVFHEHPGRRYSLTDVGMTLVSGGPTGASYGAYVQQHHQEPLMRAWARVEEAVADEEEAPFAKANGVTAYDCYGQRPEMNELMQRAMTGVSVPFMEAMLEGYVDGFEGAATVVDVGGSSGACLKMILERHPGVREGINFDLPEVVAKAPPIPGVTHVGGDMFKSIPSSDVIFMKWILTTWTDEECRVIMKHCFDALPKKGRLIACEPVLPEDTDSSQRTRALLAGDIFVMTIYRAKGKHRTEEEFRHLGKSVGFVDFRAIHLDHFYTILEFQK